MIIKIILLTFLIPITVALVSVLLGFLSGAIYAFLEMGFKEGYNQIKHHS